MYQRKKTQIHKQDQMVQNIHPRNAADWIENKLWDTLRSATLGTFLHLRKMASYEEMTHARTPFTLSPSRSLNMVLISDAERWIIPS